MMLNPSSLKALAAEQLGKNRAQAAQIVKVYILVLLAAQIVNLVAGQVLLAISDTLNSLSSGGLRATLISASMILNLVVGAFGPLWKAGLIACCMMLCRGVPATSRDLTFGLRHFGKFLVCGLLLALRIFLGVYGIMFGVITVLSFVAPASFNVDMDLEAFQAGDPAAVSAFIRQLLPILVVILVLEAAYLIWLLFRYRLAMYVAADQPDLGGSAILRTSARTLKGFWLPFFKLDLSFWWFYLLLVAAEAIPLVGLILDSMGIPVPLGSDIFSYITSFIYLAASGLIAYFFYGRVYATYAAAYYRIAVDGSVPAIEG